MNEELEILESKTWKELKEIWKRLEKIEDNQNILIAIKGFIKFWDDKNTRILNRKEITLSDAFERSLSHFLRSKYNFK